MFTTLKKNFEPNTSKILLRNLEVYFSNHHVENFRGSLGNFSNAQFFNTSSEVILGHNFSNALTIFTESPNEYGNFLDSKKWVNEHQHFGVMVG